MVESCDSRWRERLVAAAERDKRKCFHVGDSVFARICVQSELEEKQQQYEALDTAFKTTSLQLRDTEATLTRTVGQLETTQSVLGQVSPSPPQYQYRRPYPLSPSHPCLPETF